MPVSIPAAQGELLLPSQGCRRRMPGVCPGITTDSSGLSTQSPGNVGTVRTLNLSLGRELKSHPPNTPLRGTSHLVKALPRPCSPSGSGKGP